MKKFILILVIIIIGGVWYGWVTINSHQYSKDEKVVVEVTKGMNATQIINALKDSKVIDSTFLFKVALRLTNSAKDLKPGVYEISKRDSYSTIIKTLSTGISFNEIQLTFLEGWNLRDYASYLISQGVITNEDEWYREAGYPASQSNSSKLISHKQDSMLVDIPQGYSLEGYLYPDTYRFYADASVSDIIAEMIKNYHSRFEDVRSRTRPQNLSWYEVMTLASVVVKEGRSFEDKKNVAGVFLNRLEIGMGLQSDPTVNYVTLKVTDNPTLEDIAIESHYNTYKYRGLPPTPIANPSVEDVRAVLEATQHDYFYFLNTQDGELVFSKTFDEHKRNRIKYGQ
ncbi:endolytic transglycosylase MltG [Candidatus Falkowbacteria bacterium]|nr:endolytic transglycosylase MltG [Candidatus Falkowbacteria bacterium]